MQGNDLKVAFMTSADFLHLRSRTTFGYPLQADLPDILSYKTAVNDLFNSCSSELPLAIVKPEDVVSPGKIPELKSGERRQMIRNRREILKDLNYGWLSQCTKSNSSFRERLTLFWANHFSCRTGNPWFAQQLNNIIRKHVLGNFRDMLLAVSQSPAMLQFLNNQQNRKASPNENFAREVMELFTMGRGHYTEQDVKEAARAFTGWGFTGEGEFEFRERQHDNGEKTILGRSGRFRGEDVLKILLDQPQTAKWIANRFWLAFVNEKPDALIIEKTATAFRNSDFSLPVLYREVFESDWFYKNENRAALVKSPVELMIPLMRDFKVRFASVNVPLLYQRLLGQVLFNPPNVAGWPWGRAWIDSSSLSFRMRLAGAFLGGRQLGLALKDGADANNVFSSPGNLMSGIKTECDWTEVIGKYKRTGAAQLTEVLAGRMLALYPDKGVLSLAEKQISTESPVDHVKETILFFSNLPEYQLC